MGSGLMTGGFDGWRGTAPSGAGGGGGSGVTSWNGLTGAVVGTLESIYAYGLANSPTADNLFEMPSGNLRFPGLSGTSHQFPGWAFFESASTPGDSRTAANEMRRYVNLSFLIGGTTYNEYTNYDPNWNGTFAQLDAYAWTVELISFTSHDDQTDSNDNALYASRLYLASSGLLSGPIVYPPPTAGGGINPGSQMLENLSLFNDIDSTHEAFSLGGYGQFLNNVTPKLNGTTVGFQTAINVFTDITPEIGDGTGWAVVDGFPSGHTVALLSANLATSPVTNGDWEWNLWVNNAAHTALESIAAFAFAGAAVAPPISLTTANVQAGLSVGGTATTFEQFGLEADGSTALTLGSTGPNNLSGTTPAKYLTFVVNGVQYAVPAWAVASPVPTANLAFWVRGDLGTAVGTDGKTMLVWNDQSGAGFNLQNDGTPQLTTNEINGLPAVEMGLGDKMFRNSLLFSGTTPRDIYAVVRMSNNTGYCVVGMGSATAGFNAMFEFVGGSNRYVWLQYGGNDAFYTDSTDYTGTVQLFRWSWDGTTLAFARGGNDVGALTFDGTFVAGDNTAQLTVGGLGSNNNNRDWNGWVAEVLIFNVKLGNTDSTTVTNYLKTKYGL